MSSDLLADLEQVRAYLKSLPPRPLSIWFIDRAADYHHFVRSLSTVTGSTPWLQSDAMTYTSPGFAGMPIYNWRSEEIADAIKIMVQNDDQDYIKPFFPFREPGIWVEMSDGNHRQLTFDQLPSPD